MVNSGVGTGVAVGTGEPWVLVGAIRPVHGRSRVRQVGIGVGERVEVIVERGGHRFQLATADED